MPRDHILLPGTRESVTFHLLVLGGTTEGSALARSLAGRRDLAPLLSFAGRTESPVPPPVPYRTGGFGGVDGLADFLRAEKIGAVVDATHPFAARMSLNAMAACRQAGVPLAVYTRPAWTPAPSLRGAPATKQPKQPQRLDCFAPLAMTVPGAPGDGITTDGWSVIPDIDAAVASLAGPSRRVFLTTGRLDLGRFRAAPQHRYLVCTIDPPDPADLPPDCVLVLARGPFAVEDEITLMRDHDIDVLVTKNSGGTAAEAKLTAARHLGVDVVMIDRPPPSGALELYSLDAILAWIEDQRGRP